MRADRDLSQAMFGAITLCRLSEADHAAVRSLLEGGASMAPEVLLLGFVQIRANWGVLQREVMKPCPCAASRCSKIFMTACPHSLAEAQQSTAYLGQ